MIVSRRLVNFLLASWAGGLGVDVCAARTPEERTARAKGPILSDADRQASLCSPSGPSGVGLLGEYFGRAGFHGAPALTRVDGVIDFDASLDWPSSSRSPRADSVRWNGWVRTPLAGRYQFHLGALNSRVTVSRQVVVENGTSSDGIDLVAGRYYPISVSIDSLRPSFDGARLEWTAPYGARYVVPKALLHLPTDAVSRPS